jgi:transcriptional regulator with XRE-family HTH domain
MYAKIPIFAHLNRAFVDLNQIRAIRKEKKISISSLSKSTGINRNRLSQIERGKVNPSFDAVVDIVHALGCKIAIII